MSNASRQLGMMHLNIQGIQGRTAELGGFLATKRIDVCSLNETFLKPSHKLQIHSYQVFRKDRTPPLTGGGVCFLVHESLEVEQIKLQTTEEAILIKLCRVLPKDVDLYILSYYCPPSKPLDLELLLTTASRFPNLIIVGDLNCRHQYW